MLLNGCKKNLNLLSFGSLLESVFQLVLRVVFLIRIDVLEDLVDTVVIRLDVSVINLVLLGVLEDDIVLPEVNFILSVLHNFLHLLHECLFHLALHNITLANGYLGGA